jgi:hypothetical protein
MTKRTESDTKGCPSCDQIVLQLVMQGTEHRHEEMQKDPDEEEEPPPTLVDHPQVPFLPKRLGDVRRNALRAVGVGSLEALEPSALGFVALEVAPPAATEGGIHVRVLVESRHFAV